jgi:hypothetical protein
MTETVKKTTTRKPKAETAAKPAKSTVKAKVNGKPNNVTTMSPSHDQIATLAHRLWAEGGYQHGRAAEDWFRAEQELVSKAS